MGRHRILDEPGHGAYQSQAEHHLRPPCGHSARQVSAVGMPQQQHRSRTKVINEITEQPHHIAVARQAAGRRAAHPRQIRIDPLVPCRGNDSLDRRLDLTVINTGAV